MFIGGLCKVKISSSRPTRRKEKIPDGNCRGTRTPPPSTIKGLYALQKSGVAGCLGKVPASSMNLFVRQGLI